MKILVFDNYDSFTYNLVHYVNELSNHTVDVVRNDQISIEDVNNYDKILLSPGPGLPNESGILLDLIKTYAPTKSILGVCLGMQAMGEVFGGKLLNLNKVYHGIATKIIVKDPTELLFKGIPETFEAGRYHSWVVDKDYLPSCLTITAEAEDGMIMGLHHNTYDVRGVQFHPESVLTPNGKQMIKNWIEN